MTYAEPIGTLPPDDASSETLSETSSETSSKNPQRVKPMEWVYRLLLFVLLFGNNSLTYGCNQLHPLLYPVADLTGLAGAVGLFIYFFEYPRAYKWAAWLLSLALFGLIIESLDTYGQYVYSFFVIKRLAYCGLALITYAVARRAGPLKIGWAIAIIGGLFFIAQIALGRIFSYGFTSDTRPTSAPETYYLMLPLLYFLMRYRQDRRYVDLLWTLFWFGLIVILLHRSVISSAVFAIGIILGLSVLGKVEGQGKWTAGRTLTTMVVLALLSLPFFSALSPKKLDAFLENIGGIAKPTEDETGNWRYEQSLYYWSKIPDRPILGWRYEGYDRGEVMANEDFPAKGTIIHSQYVDMLYNYGGAGLALNLFVILSTLWIIYRRNRQLTFEQTILFAFIASGLLFGVSYQLPIYYWSFVGLGLFFGRDQKAETATTEAPEPDAPLPPVLHTQPTL